MATLESPLTKSTRVYRELRRDITNGVYQPGQQLVRRAMLKKYSVSLSIVNEALSRLTHDGLIEQGERESARVIQPNEERMFNDLMLREAIERQVVRLLAEKASDETLAGLLQDAQSLDRWIATEGANITLHLEFHLKMARATGYRSLEETLRPLGMRSMLVARWLKAQSLHHAPDFHEELVRAIMTRNPAVADEKMRAHLHYAEEAGLSGSPKPADSTPR